MTEKTGYSVSDTDCCGSPVAEEGRLPTMTILCAMDCGDHLLLASDSMVYDPDTGISSLEDKLWPVPELRMVGAYTGLTPLAEDFRRWLDSEDKARFVDWGSFRASVVERLAEINSDQKRLAEKAAATFRGLVAVFVGYVGGTPEIFTVDAAGVSTLARAAGLVTAGHPPAQAAALAVLQALEQERGDDFSPGEDVLRSIMEIATGISAICAPPVQMYRVDAREVVKLP